MPRIARARTGVFDDLADQLRFAPRATLLRQITRAERLGGEIDEQENYPEDWLVARITGYRPEIDDPALIVGKAILTDLSSFVELLCERAALTIEDLGERETQTIDDLGAQWRVDRRTIERYRRRGLVARRVRTGAKGGTRLVFTATAVRAFEARHADLLAESAAFSRLSDQEIALIERRAPRYARALAWPRTQIAARLALRLGRSPGAVLRVLRDDDRGGTREPVDRDELFEKWRDGASVKSLVAMTGRTRSATHHAINTHRAHLIRGVSLVVTPNSDDARALEHEHARSGLMPVRWGDARQFVEFARSTSPASRAGERARASALAHLRWRVHHMSAGLGEGRASTATLDRIETDLRWIARLVGVLVRDEAPVILRGMEERAGCDYLELTPSDASAWFARSIGAACGAAVRFDPSRGGRLAAPVTLALSQALAPMRAERAEAGRARSAALLPDWAMRACAWQAWAEPGARARAIMLGDDEAGRLLRARYGLDGGRPRTAEEMGEEFGVGAAGLARVERG